MIIIYPFGGDSYAFLCLLISFNPISTSKGVKVMVEHLLDQERPDQEDDLLGNAVVFLYEFYMFFPYSKQNDSRQD